MFESDDWTIPRLLMTVDISVTGGSVCLRYVLTRRDALYVMPNTRGGLTR